MFVVILKFFIRFFWFYWGWKFFWSYFYILIWGGLFYNFGKCVWRDLGWFIFIFVVVGIIKFLFFVWFVVVCFLWKGCLKFCFLDKIIVFFFNFLIGFWYGRLIDFCNFWNDLLEDFYVELLWSLCIFLIKDMYLSRWWVNFVFFWVLIYVNIKNVYVYWLIERGVFDFEVCCRLIILKEI